MCWQESVCGQAEGPAPVLQQAGPDQPWHLRAGLPQPAAHLPRPRHGQPPVPGPRAGPQQARQAQLLQRGRVPAPPHQAQRRQVKTIHVT